MSATTRNIAVVAASSVVPQVELAAGGRLLREAGFEVTLNPQCAAAHFTFAGTDVERCGALWDAATDETNDVIWMARGGYGAARLLPMLEELTQHHGPPAKRKLLVGYSDVTVLHEYVRHRWGWPTLHAPMPSAPTSEPTTRGHWSALLDSCAASTPAAPGRAAAHLAGHARGVEAELVGGNLALWASIAGTPHPPRPAAGASSSSKTLAKSITASIECSRRSARPACSTARPRYSSATSRTATMTRRTWCAGR